jgi:hypothetical protein
LTEAYQGKWRTSPEGKVYFGNTFSMDPNNDYPETSTIYPTVVKPPADKELRDETVRARLRQIADHSKTIGGHYRWFAYTRGDISGDPARQCPPGVWCASEHAGPMMCASFIWSSAQAANVQVENLLKDPLDPGDINDRPHALSPAQRGLYRYTESERRNAADWLYAHIRNEVLDTDGKAFLVNADDRFASQMCNAFASDDCALPPVNPDPFVIPCSERGSHAWEHPGEGVTVAPDDILNWNMPPNGVYGLNEPMEYMPGAWGRVYQWVRSEGTADIVANVKLRGLPWQYAKVILYVGGFSPQTTDEAGQARFRAVPCGQYEIQADLAVPGTGLRFMAKKLVDVPCAGEISVELNLVEFIPEVPRELKRKVTISGNLYLEDQACLTAGTAKETFPFSFEEVLNPITNPNHTFRFEQSLRATKGMLEVTAHLYDGEIQVAATIIFFDGGKEKYRRTAYLDQPYGYVRGWLTGLRIRWLSDCFPGLSSVTQTVNADLLEISNVQNP